jgi:alpha-L-fucosidase
MRSRLALLALLPACLAAPQELPRPDRMGVTNTGPYDYGVMGPPATRAIVAAAGPAYAFRITGLSIPNNSR